MDDVEEEEEEGDVKRLGGPFVLDVLGTDWEGRRDRGRGKDGEGAKQTFRGTPR